MRRSEHICARASCYILNTYLSMNFAQVPASQVLAPSICTLCLLETLKASSHRRAGSIPLISITPTLPAVVVRRSSVYVGMQQRLNGGRHEGESHGAARSLADTHTYPLHADVDGDEVGIGEGPFPVRVLKPRDLPAPNAAGHQVKVAVAVKVGRGDTPSVPTGNRFCFWVQDMDALRGRKVPRPVGVLEPKDLVGGSEHRYNVVVPISVEIGGSDEPVWGIFRWIDKKRRESINKGLEPRRRPPVATWPPRRSGSRGARGRLFAGIGPDP